MIRLEFIVNLTIIFNSKIWVGTNLYLYWLNSISLKVHCISFTKFVVLRFIKQLTRVIELFSYQVYANMNITSIIVFRISFSKFLLTFLILFRFIIIYVDQSSSLFLMILIYSRVFRKRFFSFHLGNIRLNLHNFAIVINPRMIMINVKFMEKPTIILFFTIILFITIG